MSGVCCLATPIGKLRLTWRQPGRLTRLELPSPATARQRATPPPAWLRPLANALVAALRGEQPRVPLAGVDWTGVPPFHRRVYEFVHRLPPGRTLTYGAVARAVGRPGAARAVGQAMARNPFPLIVPCHRVVAATGLGGFGGGLALKRRLLQREGAWPPATACRGVARRPRQLPDRKYLGNGCSK